MPNMKQKILNHKRKQHNLKKKTDDTLAESDNFSVNLDEHNAESDDIETSINVSIKLWDDIKNRIKTEPEFINMSDTEKVALYQLTDYNTFYTAFPIVSRYMICMGQFSVNSFKKYLYKCKNIKHDPIKSKENGYTEDQWIQRQADYVRYLWESYQKINFSNLESDNIWKSAYET